MTTARGSMGTVGTLGTVAVFGTYLIIALGLGVLSREEVHVSPLWSMVLLGVAGLGVLSMRKSRASAAFIIAVVLTLFSCALGTGAEYFIVLVILYRAGVHRSAVAAWVLLGITVVAASIGSLILAWRFQVGPPLWGLALPMTQRDPLLDWANSYVMVAVIALVVTLLGVNVGHRRRYVGALVDRAQQMERERDQQAEISSALERERIAREMHDVIAHSLAVMIAMADGAVAAATHRPEDSAQAMGRVADTGRRTLDEVRRLLGAVRGEQDSTTTTYAPQPDASQVEVLVEEFRTAGLPVQLQITGSPAADRVLGLSVYRIVQESLTNVLRHARDTHAVTVAVQWTDSDVHILVEDDSAVVAEVVDPGRGLVGIRERAALYDGQVYTGPRTDGGWRVSVRLHSEEQ